MIKSDEVNKKAGGLFFTATEMNKYYSFVVDGSLNTPTIYLKYFIDSIKLNLKKNIFNYDLHMAVVKSVYDSYDKFKNRFDFEPVISIGACKNNHGELEIVLLNDIKCFLKTDRVNTICDRGVLNFEDRVFDIANNQEKLKLNRNSFRSMLDKNSYVVRKYSYDDTYSIILCNLIFQNYQKYLRLTDTDFNTMVEREGLKYIFNHIRRIESMDKDINDFMRLNSVNDAAGIFRILL